MSGMRVAGLIAAMVSAVQADAVFGQQIDSASLRVIAVDGRAVRVYSRGLTRGGTRPVVVFEGGSTARIESWKSVLDALSDTVSFLAYDSPGIGESEWNAVRPTPEAVSDWLRRVLREAGARPPYVVVGHSWAAWNVRAFAGRYAEETVGMVLIDPTPPVADIIAALNDIGAGERGLEEFVSLGERFAVDAPEPIRARQSVISEYYRKRVDPDVPQSTSLPVIVLVAGRYDSTEIPEPIRPSFDTNAFFTALRRRQTVTPIAWVSESPNGILIYTAGNAHCIQCDDPHVVGWAISRLLRSLGQPRR